MSAWIESKPTMVEGVQFQLECAVDKARWEPLHHLGVHSNRAALFGPELIFPWTPVAVRDFIAETVSPIDVAPGSTVFVGFVDDAPLKSAFPGFEGEEEAQ